MRDAVCRKCRAAGQKLFLKGEKCFSPKCPMVKKPYKPGNRTKRPRILSEYGRQLLEKQKVRWTYGIRESQMRKYFELAKKIVKNKKGITLDEAFIQELERRLDNVVFRAGFGVSRAQARQLVSHGHFSVNGRKVTIPSYQVKEGDIIEIMENSTKIKLVEEIKKRIEKFNLVPWLEYLKGKIAVKVKSLPAASESNNEFNLNLVVEFYSR